METVCATVLLAELIRVGWVDAKTRAVLLLDVVALLLARAVFALLAVGGAFPEGSSAYCLWAPAGIVSSGIAAVAVVAFLWFVGKAVSFLTGKEALGMGDVWLCAVLPLFLRADDAPLFLAASAMGALIQAFWCIGRGRADFPFAPSLAASCAVIVVWRLWLQG